MGAAFIGECFAWKAVSALWEIGNIRISLVVRAMKTFILCAV